MFFCNTHSPLLLLMTLLKIINTRLLPPLVTHPPRQQHHALKTDFSSEHSWSTCHQKLLLFSLVHSFSCPLLYCELLLPTHRLNMHPLAHANSCKDKVSAEPLWILFPPLQKQTRASRLYHWVDILTTVTSATASTPSRIRLTLFQSEQRSGKKVCIITSDVFPCSAMWTWSFPGC